MSLEEAVAAIEGAGLVVGDAFGPANGDPFITDPAAGTEVRARRHRRHLPAPVEPLRCAAMGALDGRVAIITGAGRGLGREHALLFAAEGAKVVVNDLGDVAEEVAEEIRAAGGEAIASNHDITTGTAARRWSARPSTPSGASTSS